MLSPATMGPPAKSYCSGISLERQWWPALTCLLKTQPAYNFEPPMAHQQNAIAMAFGWWADAGPTLFANWEGPWSYQGSREEWVLENYFLYFSSNTYVVGTQKNHLNERVF